MSETTKSAVFLLLWKEVSLKTIYERRFKWTEENITLYEILKYTTKKKNTNDYENQEHDLLFIYIIEENMRIPLLFRFSLWLICGWFLHSYIKRKYTLGRYVLQQMKWWMYISLVYDHFSVQNHTVHQIVKMIAWYCSKFDLVWTNIWIIQGGFCNV